MPVSGRRIARLVSTLAAALASSWVPAAAESPGTLVHSFDVTVSRPGPATYDDEAAIRETETPAWSAVSLGTLPAGADLTALHHANDGRWYFSLDTFAHLGTIDAGPEDVVAWNGASYELVFDGSAAGIPAGASVDAVSEGPKFGLLLSFDVTIPVGMLAADDADILAWDGAELSILFDAGSAGIPASLDLDALDVDATNDSVYVSFDVSGKLGGVDFDDHDLLHFDGVTWTKVSYAGLSQTGTGAADLDAADYVTPGIFADGFETSDRSRWSGTT